VGFPFLVFRLPFVIVGVAAPALADDNRQTENERWRIDAPQNFRL
jgi:hypothetical protein